MLLAYPIFVIPAKAGIQENQDFLDPGFHRGDVTVKIPLNPPLIKGEELHFPPFCKGGKGGFY